MEYMGGTLLFFAWGCALGMLMVPAVNWVPPSWVCEYGETPEPWHGERRLEYVPGGLLLTAVLAFFGAFLFWQSGQWFFAGTGLVMMWLLCQSAVLDGKYRILPDQYTLGICGVGLVVAARDFFLLLIGQGDQCLFHDSYASPLVGCLICGGGLLASGLIAGKAAGLGSAGKGGIEAEAEDVVPAVGFGDVKLMGALGFIFGTDLGLLLLICSGLFSGIGMGLGLLLGKNHREEGAAMGPYLSLSAAVCLAIRFHSPGALS